MKRIAVVLLAVVLSGQGCPSSAPPEPAFDRLAPNDHLRVACAGFLPNDAAIESMLALCESDRLAGIDKRTAEVGSLVTCSGMSPAQVATECGTCTSAIIQQIHGQ